MRKTEISSDAETQDKPDSNDLGKVPIITPVDASPPKSGTARSMSADPDPSVQGDANPESPAPPKDEIPAPETTAKQD